MFQNYTIIGRLTKDNEIKYVGTNQDFALLNNVVATSDKDNKGNERTLFMPFSIFGKKAEVINKFLKKGDPILLQGKIVEQKWTDSKTNEPKSRFVLEATDFAFMGTNSNKQQHNDPF